MLQLAPLQVGVLVNNVGVSYPHAEYYESIDDQLIDDLIAINIQATNKVCLLVTPLSDAPSSSADHKPGPVLWSFSVARYCHQGSTNGA